MRTADYRARTRLLAIGSAIALCAMSYAGVAQAQLRKTVAVVGFDGTMSFEGGDAAQGLTAMLSDALIKDGRFVVVERAAIADVAAEHQINASTTQLTPATALLRGTVTKFNPKASGVGLSGGMLGGSSLGGALGVNSDTAEVELNLRLIDAASGQVLASVSAKGSASNKGVSANIYTKSGMTIGSEAFMSTPLGQAAQDAIKDAIGKIANAMANVNWSAQVLSADTGQIYIDAGSIQNVAVGDVFQVYRKGKVLTDPNTNAVIDVLEDRVGAITISSVREKTSAGIVSDGTLPQRGDVVREK